MNLFKFLRAIITRVLFILVALMGIWRVTWVTKNLNYWILIGLFLPLLIEMVVTLKDRKGKDYKWISPPIFLFLISIIPTMWILEIHHQTHKDSDSKCIKLDSWENMQKLVKNTTLEYESDDDYTHIFTSMFTSVCSNVWILALHQIVLILLIVGKWLLPLGGGVTREELSQLLITFVGTAADILEFTSETLSDIKGKSPELIYIILAVWTWSMLQFPLHLAVVSPKKENEGVVEAKPESLMSKHSTDVFSIMESVFIQDGPFLVVRVTIIIYYKVFHQMLVFFAVKNILVVILSMYRLYVLCRDFSPTSSQPGQAQYSAGAEAPGQAPEEATAAAEAPGQASTAATAAAEAPGQAPTAATAAAEAPGQAPTAAAEAPGQAPTAAVAAVAKQPDKAPTAAAEAPGQAPTAAVAAVAKQPDKAPTGPAVAKQRGKAPAAAAAAAKQPGKAPATAAAAAVAKQRGQAAAAAAKQPGKAPAATAAAKQPGKAPAAAAAKQPGKAPAAAAAVAKQRGQAPAAATAAKQPRPGVSSSSAARPGQDRPGRSARKRDPGTVPTTRPKADPSTMPEDNPHPSSTSVTMPDPSTISEDIAGPSSTSVTIPDPGPSSEITHSPTMKPEPEGDV